MMTSTQMFRNRLVLGVVCAVLTIASLFLTVPMMFHPTHGIGEVLLAVFTSLCFAGSSGIAFNLALMSWRWEIVPFNLQKKALRLK